jgi:hypothetical protein
MNQQFKAAWEVHQFFTKEVIPYAIIGGIALQRWGEPRFTRDVDVTILVNIGEEEEIVKSILSVFTKRIPDALEFALRNRICLVRSKEGCEIDISLGIPGYEEEVVNRAVDCDLTEDYTVKICSAEDVVIHKAVTGRPQDLIDIKSVIIRQGDKLDVKYVQKWPKEFSHLLEDKEIIERFEEPWKRLEEEG